MTDAQRARRLQVRHRLSGAALFGMLRGDPPAVAAVDARPEAGEGPPPDRPRAADAAFVYHDENDPEET